MGAQYQQYRAPTANNESLVAPPLSALDVSPWRPPQEVELLGKPLEHLRSEARRQLLTAASEYTSTYRELPELPSVPPAAPLLLTGHQAELFHPGVWFKNFMLSRLADQHGGVGIHLVIDSDLARAASIRVPTGSVKAPRVEAVPYDAPAPSVAVEERRIVDRGVFDRFADRVRQTMAPLLSDPLVGELWPAAREAANRTGGNPGLALAQSRHSLEAKWGGRTLEVPLSRCCELPAFRWFLCYLLSDAARLRTAYNGALAAFRTAHRVRNDAQPMPDLGGDDEWLETPFWVWSSHAPERLPLFVQPRGQSITLTDRRKWFVEMGISPNGSAERAVEQLEELSAAGVRIRPRALMTTFFSRLVLGDLFLHGIGGAKYDEVTDDLSERLLGFAPPGFLTLSATLRLPIDHPRGGAADVRDARQWLRELTYHPDRHLPAGAARHGGSTTEATRAVAEEKHRWIHTKKTSANAAERHRAIAEANEALQSAVADKRRRIVSRLERYEQLARARAVLDSREFSFCLFPEEDLRERMFALVGETKSKSD